MNSEVRKQTLLITGLNGAIRAMGFLLRIIMARMLGAEMMGIAELASGVHMLAITPLTSGLPMAISRLTAKETEKNRCMPLMAGLGLVQQACFFLIPAFFIFSPLLARLVGDIRVLPSLWCSAPCILILGYSAAYNGYCYGTGRSSLPAVSELLEQTLRLVFALVLLPVLSKLSASWLAAVPVASTMLAEAAGLVMMVFILRISCADKEKADAWRKPILHLALPSTGTRLLHTMLRSVTAILIPIRLGVSGLNAAEATARLGMLNGMVLPLMMLPCIFTGALSMVMAPRLARSDENARQCKSILSKLFAAGLLVALSCSGMLALLAPFFSSVIYRLPELTDLLLSAVPLCFLCAGENLTVGAITSLGLQKQALAGAILSSLVSLLLTWWLTAMPDFRLQGVIIGLAAGHILVMLWNGGILLRWWRSHSCR